MGRNTLNIDSISALLLLCLGSFGVFILLTIDRSLFLSQVFFLVIAFFLMIVISKIDAILLWWAAPFAYIFANILLVFSYFGPSIRGATRWIFIFGVQLQPSELVKPLFLLSMAYFISKYPPRNLVNIPKLLGLFALPFLLVFRQPDLGSSLIYGVMWVAMMASGGLPIWTLIAGVGSIAVLFPLLWSHLAPYQRSRIETFLNPALDPSGAGYNAIQAMIAVGSGQMFGRGLGRGTQSHLRFLPEFHTDFIFATLIEELGFIAGLFLLIGFGILLYRIISPFWRSNNADFSYFVFATGLFAMILAQLVINIGMNMGLIPVTGITIPFVSYGGSSILATGISFGLLWAIARGTKS